MEPPPETETKNDDISLIHDIAALRIIVPTIEDCYTTLGTIHALYRPIPGEFKDYIAFPKPNGYQSLHTTVVTPEAGIVEIQVRTEEMHRHAVYGIASHMSYKQLGKGIEKLNKGVQKSRFASLSFSWRSLIPSLMRVTRNEGEVKTKTKIPPWLAELAEAHAGDADSEEFVEGLKEDFSRIASSSSPQMATSSIYQRLRRRSTSPTQYTAILAITCRVQK